MSVPVKAREELFGVVDWSATVPNLMGGGTVVAPDVVVTQFPSGSCTMAQVVAAADRRGEAPADDPIIIGTKSIPSATVAATKVAPVRGLLLPPTFSGFMDDCSQLGQHARFLQ